LNALHLLFRTDRFNLSKVGKDFINPCCFGEDLAAWLQGTLPESGVEICKPYQEDWGWELPVRRGAQRYYICISGNADESAANPDLGEWRMIIEKKRSLWQRLTGDRKITRNDEMVALVQRILSSEDGVSDVRIEDVERIL
jgi:hypothetical protein